MADKKSSRRPSAESMRGEVEILHENFVDVDVDDDPKKNVQQPDRFGSFAKVDPKEIALVKKLDWHMMPILWLMYFLNFLDRNAIVNGKLNNLTEELGSVEYACHKVQAITDYHGMLACRLVLGLTEAPFYPGGIYLVSLFYTRKESATRLAIFYTGNMMASTFSGLIAAGVFAGLNGSHGLSGWRWLFLIQGVVTVGVAAASFFFLPDTPLTTRWLTEEERQLAHDRIARDTTGKRKASSTWVGLWDAARDYRTWLFALMVNLHLSANNFKNYLPTAVKSLGFDTTALAIVGFVVATATYNIGARYFAIVLFVGATYGVNNISLAWTAATVGQTDEKKAAAIAIVNSLGNLSFVYTPYLWNDTTAPLFRPAMLGSVGFSAGVVIVAWVMKWVLIRANRKIRATDNEATNFFAY
ncbi:putative mfs transporter protein [Eutypa lata UCREL1]|uniref:Putative mfs transporter protein n=1 Tax=Eutypa lata (strain UCR-EL1) TaxID=1287681 RepID=M7SXV1_EUTLA|nr:putative mfs transporter protein [Eutypa lata UCREL1]